MDKQYAHLNPQQREAALHGDGPLLILAGAGSGKTAVMTHRIAHLIEDEGVKPWNILAVTFTNKAAGEMRDRVAKLLNNNLEDSVWIMTFHAVCLRILRRHAERLGYKNGFAVYDPSDQKAVAKRIVKELDYDPKKYAPSYVLSTISKYKEQMKTPAKIRETAEGAYAPTLSDMAEIYGRYEKMLRGNNAMDFDDLLLNVVRLFEREPDMLEEYRRRWRYVLVDEYQDTNRLQYLFVRALAEGHRNICVVGDDDQCIYQWRGADIRNILDFERDFAGAKVVRLEQNYRSTGHILSGANSVIRGNRGRKEKALWTDRGDGEKIVYRVVRDEQEEARFVAEEALRLSSLPRGAYRLGDMAVLTRTNAQSRTFEEAFIARGIDYQMLGQVRYYDRKEIKDMLSYMALVLNPDDDVAFLRIVNEPRRGVGAKGAEGLMRAAAAGGVSIMASLRASLDPRGASGQDAGGGALSGKAAAAVAGLVESLAGLTAVHAQMKVSEVYDELLEKTGYLRALQEKNTVEDDVRAENLLEFRSAILESEAEDPTVGLSDFLEKIALMSDIDNHDRAADAITCMTLHSAKGLEFPVVFMPGMEEGLFPNTRTLDDESGVEEERRLCYVGMTRARERLYLVRARERTLYGNRDYTVESRFLQEVDKGALDESADMPGRDTTGYLHQDAWSDDGYGYKRRFGKIGGGWGGGAAAAPRTAAPRTAAPALALEKGDRVAHPKFGGGLVLDADENYATVLFDKAGKKKLALDIAPLEKL
ncbi:MAG: UvrD-helicase domain-containing protein [Clostridiales Family XIII bacterium]|jgi:DNA helicase-2/ATP-dependent DNA helicase PcrA|nr:UvrD-helicase domain-containing protein [Clostridiales Family XIII bacterium]